MYLAVNEHQYGVRKTAKSLFEKPSGVHSFFSNAVYTVL
jgi:hypothetical protein